MVSWFNMSLLTKIQGSKRSLLPFSWWSTIMTSTKQSFFIKRPACMMTWWPTGQPGPAPLGRFPDIGEGGGGGGGGGREGGREGGSNSSSYRALSRFELSVCYHQNLGIFGKFGFFRKKYCKKNLPSAGQITFWKYNGKSIFWLFENTDQNS